MAAENEGFVEFFGDAADDYANLINDVSGVVDFWELLLDLAENPEIDFERIFEFPSEDELLKIVYGPPWTVVFKNRLDGTLIVYVIRRPSF